MAVQFDETSDSGLSGVEILNKYGYPTEEHKVFTKDGYILTLQRIPNKIKSNATKCNKRVVFLLHGIACSSRDFLVLGPKKSLAFLLADQGYDVWMGNSRGNMHSKCHKTLHPEHNKSQFWNFSWHEIGIYDIPAMIDYILKVAIATKLFFIGYSQATTAFFVCLSMLPEYNAKVCLGIQMAPTAIITNGRLAVVSFPVMKILWKIVLIQQLATIVGKFEVLALNGYIQRFFQVICSGRIIPVPWGWEIVKLCMSWTKTRVAMASLSIIFTHWPCGTSVKAFLHYVQNHFSGRFCQYDYGPKSNLKRYGMQGPPPDYPLKNVTAPVALFYSKNDRLANSKDIQTLARILPNAVYNYEVPVEPFEHIDFIYAKDAASIVYKHIIKLMHKY